MKFKFIFIIFFILIFSETQAQPVEEWVQRYNGSANSYDIVSKMLIDNNNNILVFGSSNSANSALDFLIVKYSPEGNVIWDKRYNGSGNSFDQISSACIDDSGNCYVTGFTTDSAFQPNITTAKFDSSGNLIWVKVFLKSGYNNGNGKDVSLDNLGNVIICGAIKNTTGFFDMEIIKYSPAGDEIWSQTFIGEGNGDDIPVAIKTDSYDNIIIAGTTKSPATNADMIIIKYSPSSSLIWKKIFNGPANSDDAMSSMVLDSDNNIYFCGNKYTASNSFDYFYAKLDANGNTIWSEDYNGTGSSLDISSSIILDSMNNVYVTGYSRSGLNNGSEDIVTIKVTQSGDWKWTKSYNGTANGTDQANSITADNNGNVYIGGASDMGNVHLIYALLKYDSLGNLLWVRNYTNSNSNTPEDFIYSVALDNKNNVYVTGISFDPVSDFDFATIKYSQTVGINEPYVYAPENFFLSQNYPNPFNPSTLISYFIPSNVKGQTSNVKLLVYNSLGKKAATLVNEKLSSGSHTVKWDASNFPSGIYFYKMTAGDFVEVKKMLLVK